MCGILLVLKEKKKPERNCATHSDIQRLIHNINKRGPDYQSTDTLDIHGCTLTYASSVLALRGKNDSSCIVSTIKQPFQSLNYILFFNGELYDTSTVLSGENDGERLFHSIIHQLSNQPQNQHHQIILHLFNTLIGEWAIVLIDILNARLYFARDCLGRRSLLWQIDKTNGLLLSSIGIKQDTLLEWSEVPAKGIYSVSIAMNSGNSEDDDNDEYIDDNDNDDNNNNNGALQSFDPILHVWPLTKHNTINPHLPQSIPINFYSLATLDHATTHLSEFQHSINRLDKLLFDSVQSRVVTIPHSLFEATPRLGILFSGGLDCMILAYYAHFFIPLDEPIDLLTVAFSTTRHTTEQCPDRITARQGLLELNALANRKWRLVCIDVTFEESEIHKRHILECAWPSSSVMDLSIAVAFWFAARGQGVLDGVAYTSKSKVLLSGLGADEQLGGYGRHVVRYLHNGWTGLIDELQLDLDRLPTRNLGRDDRIIGDHGKEVRFPYLDESIVLFLSKLKIQIKCNPEFEKGRGDKILLRSLAMKHGLRLTSKEPKRAVQFGARSAKMSNRKEKGSDLID